MTETEKQCQAWLDYFEKCGLTMANLKNIRKHDGEQMLVLVLKRLQIGTPVELVKACER